MTCGSGEAVVGLRVEFGQYINEVSVECARLRSDGSTGIRYTKGRAGSPGPKSFYFYCPDDSVLVGVRGRSGTYLDNIGGLCMNLVTKQVRAEWDHGGFGGTQFVDYCPSSYAVTSLYFRSAALVDGVRATCAYVTP